MFTSFPRAFDESGYRVLHIGTNPNKNLLRVVDALRGLPCHLRVIGCLNSEQRRCLDESGLDYSDAFNLTDAEMVSEYHSSDMVVFVSTYEGFGMPILEGQATGRPVVTSNLPSMTEVAGDGACLVDPFEVASIRAGIERVATDSGYRGRLIANGFVNVAGYTREVVGEMYGALYVDVYRRSVYRFRGTPSAERAPREPV
jgi:glycosyltransferase involved in cell wall biosynthesis